MTYHVSRAIERPARRKLLYLSQAGSLPLNPNLETETMAAKQLEPIHPGEILREEFMKPMGVSINALAREIAVPPNRVSDIVNGKRSITADTALRLGKYFGVSPGLWLGLQVDYDLRVARRTTWLKAESRVRAHSA